MYVKTNHINYVLIGNHPSIQQIRELITMVSDTAFGLLYNKSIKINCPALPLMLLDKELFGNEKGAYTYA